MKEIRKNIDEENLRLLIDAKKLDSARVKKFLDLGADVNTEGNEGATLLLRALQQRDLPLVDFLLDQGANPAATFKTKDRTAALDIFCHAFKADKESLRVLQKMLDKGAVVDQPSGSGMTSLLLCVRNCYVEFARVLLKNGANPDLTLPGFGTPGPLFSAVRTTNTQILRLLLDYNANLEIRNEEGQTLLEQMRHDAPFFHDGEKNLALVEKEIIKRAHNAKLKEEKRIQKAVFDNTVLQRPMKPSKKIVLKVSL